MTGGLASERGWGGKSFFCPKKYYADSKTMCVSRGGIWAYKNLSLIFTVFFLYTHLCLFGGWDRANGWDEYDPEKIRFCASQSGVVLQKFCKLFEYERKSPTREGNFSNQNDPFSEDETKKGYFSPSLIPTFLFKWVYNALRSKTPANQNLQNTAVSDAEKPRIVSNPEVAR